MSPWLRCAVQWSTDGKGALEPPVASSRLALAVPCSAGGRLGHSRFPGPSRGQESPQHHRERLLHEEPSRLLGTIQPCSPTGHRG